MVSVVSDLSEFRKQAQHCIDQSELSSSAESKAHWLRIAQGWMVLAGAAEFYESDAADPTYQVSILEKDGTPASEPANIQSADDASIIKEAKQLVDGKTVEVKEGERLVATFPPSD
jgi:hypothetical protein